MDKCIKYICPPIVNIIHENTLHKFNDRQLQNHRVTIPHEKTHPLIIRHSLSLTKKKSRPRSHPAM